MTGSSLFSDADAERMKWLSGIVGVSPRSITDEGAQELHALCLRAIRALGYSVETPLLARRSA